MMNVTATQGRRRIFDSPESFQVSYDTRWPQEDLGMQKMAYGGGGYNDNNAKCSAEAPMRPSMNMERRYYPSSHQMRRQLQDRRRSREDFASPFNGYDLRTSFPQGDIDNFAPTKDFSMRHPVSSGQPWNRGNLQYPKNFNMARRRGWSTITRMKDEARFGGMNQSGFNSHPQIPRLSVPAPAFEMPRNEPPQLPRFGSIDPSARNQFGRDKKWDFSCNPTFSTTQQSYQSFNSFNSMDMKASNSFTSPASSCHASATFAGPSNPSFNPPSSSNIQKDMESMRIEQSVEKKTSAPVVAEVKDCKPLKAVVLQQHLERSRGDGFIAFVPVTLGEVKPRKYKCLHCKKVFKQRSTVMAHVRTHTGEKPFKCSLCHRGFTQRSNLKRHEFTRHEAHLQNSATRSDVGLKQQQQTSFPDRASIGR
uniref:C2H2-type domain-containing protein n=1 Tax=Lotharella globosa TaxID=91324 RepID=A0A7S4DWU1_9EUKA|mmetsp:Transcript_3568/g.7170  ORF Transcript_3568/g.7170 Transcript_3568/m.7170 type:complete len:421 (+) Transcript_3568:81-1343(+)